MVLQLTDVTLASEAPPGGQQEGTAWIHNGELGKRVLFGGGQGVGPLMPDREQGWGALTPGEGQGGASDDWKFYAAMALLGVLAVLGVAGNLLVLWVFRRKKDKLLSTLFIIVLAVVDLTTCLLIIPYTIYMETVHFFVHSDFVCKLYQFLITSNIPFSAFIMVVIAVDRYFCICHPFVAALSERRAKLVVIALALAASALGVCVALMHGVSASSVERYVDGNSSNASALATLSKYRLNVPPAPELRGLLDQLLGASNDYFNRSDALSAESPQISGQAWKGIRGSGTGRPEMIVINDGKCRNNERFLSGTFLWVYHKLYVLLFLACLLAVVVLYVLIYRAVLQRRARRQRQLSGSRALRALQHGAARRCSARGSTELDTLQDAALDAGRGGPGSTELDVLQDAALDAGRSGPGSTELYFLKKDLPRRCSARGSTSGAASSEARRVSVEARCSAAERRAAAARPSSLTAARDRLWVANLKTAGVLFVVTVVFVVTFLPAFLITLDVLPHSVLVFNLYFANNVANPFIYSFMNKNFRDDLRALLCARHGSGSGAATCVY